ncbi:MAG: hypothetical protein A4E71_02614 [Smithella sp. PtaU1.Bin162]|nr:MAG: hypothetical protein A4E71_02614 [Smithella sp. PtaU1.Bin162]
MIEDKYRDSDFKILKFPGVLWYNHLQGLPRKRTEKKAADIANH